MSDEPVYTGPCQVGTKWARVKDGAVRKIVSVEPMEGLIDNRVGYTGEFALNYSCSLMTAFDTVADMEAHFVSVHEQITEEEIQATKDRILNFQSYRERSLNI